MEWLSWGDWRIGDGKDDGWMNCANFDRECWCAQSLSSLSKKVDDSECNLPCEGNKNQVCGGNLKLTVSIDPAPRLLYPRARHLNMP